MWTREPAKKRGEYTLRMESGVLLTKALMYEGDELPEDAERWDRPNPEPGEEPDVELDEIVAAWTAEQAAKRTPTRATARVTKGVDEEDAP